MSKLFKVAYDETNKTLSIIDEPPPPIVVTQNVETQTIEKKDDEDGLQVLRIYQGAFLVSLHIYLERFLVKKERPYIIIEHKTGVEPDGTCLDYFSFQEEEKSDSAKSIMRERAKWALDPIFARKACLPGKDWLWMDFVNPKFILEFQEPGRIKATRRVFKI